MEQPNDDSKDADGAPAPELAGGEKYRLYMALIFVLGLPVSLALSYTLATSLDWKNIDFGGTLSIVLAMFSIFISFIFYQKAQEAAERSEQRVSETANQFYDNSYRFTREVSEILGRIEGAFGEKLSTIHEVNTRVSEQLTRMPIAGEDAEKQLEETKAEVDKIRQEYQQLVSKLPDATDPGTEDKVRSVLEEKEQQLMQARTEAEAAGVNAFAMELIDADPVSFGWAAEYMRYTVDELRHRLARLLTVGKYDPIFYDKLRHTERVFRERRRG